VVRSSAVPDENVEVQAALHAGIPVLKRSEFLGQLTRDDKVIAVAGSHGKTTTTAILAWVLMELDQDPSFIVGGVVKNLHTNARSGKGGLFVIEADEYDEMFLGLHPDIAVVTNIEYDHPDYFPTPEDFKQAFRDFVGNVTDHGVMILCAEDPSTVKLRHQASVDQEVYFYGFYNPDFNYMARNLQPREDGCYHFDFYTGDIGVELIEDVHLGIPGEHNVLNALAALAVVDQLDLPLENSIQALAAFEGSGRRFEIRGEFSGVVIIDDYAHHPTQIKTAIETAGDRYPDGELWVIWQPHTFSRTMALLDGYSSAFGGADHVIVTEVYPSREEQPPGFSISEVVDAIDHPDVSLQSTFEEVEGNLVPKLAPKDVVLILSAGDAIELSAQLAGTLSNDEKKER
jgi:UDP-N-acetylmuramate--alanine ligase